MRAELLLVRELSVSFVTESGVARVLDAVSLSLASGEIMGLVGESGCGKTTLARAILGALPANANVRGGALMFDGEDLLALDPLVVAEQVRGRAITFVPQDPYSSFSPLFTIGDQIMELLRWKSPDRRAGERFMVAQPPPCRSRTGTRVAAGRATAGSRTCAAKISARTVGRAAAARDDRHGLVAGTKAGDRR